MKKTTSKWGLAVLAVIGIIILLRTKAIAKATLFGKVTDLETGQPITWASIGVGGPMAREPSVRTFTVNGEYLLEGLEIGEHTIFVAKSGWEPVEKIITLIEGTNEFNVGLERSIEHFD